MASEAPRDARDQAAARLRAALELFEAGVKMMRQTLRRNHPALTDLEIDARVRAWLAGRLATARLVPRGGDEAGIVLDVLFASSGIEPEIADAADVLEILPGLRVPVAGVGHLLALKLLSRDDRTRPQDRVDLAQLLRATARTDIEVARGAVALIHARGFQRDRDLSRALEELID